ncbi:MAG TPA: sulfite exporter TauE/SafE family protein [Longimicrobiales bacterium]|nr:sulfite exporter TauE/SafE family protein [Longimicrobiales bacterium]
MLESPLVFGLVAVLGGAVAAVSGFGIGSLLTPWLLLSFAAADAVAIVAVPHAVATTVRFFRLRKHIDRPTFREFGIASAVGGLAGALLQPVLGSGALTLVLAVLLLAAGSSELARRPVPLPATPFWRLTGGILSGVFGGLVGNQGGIRSAALLGFRLDTRTLVATATASALLVDAARVPIYVVMRGSVLAATVPLWAAGTVGVVVGTFLGVPLLGRIAVPLYRRIVGGLLVALGISLVAAAV